MITVPDLELTVRIGSPDPPTSAALRSVAGWSGLGHGDAVDLVRGLHWVALGRAADAPAAAVVAALMLTPRSAATCDRIGADLDEVYAATAAHRLVSCPSDPPGMTGARMLGWRLTIALDLVHDEERESARTSEQAP